VQALVGAGSVAAATEDVSALSDAAGSDKHFCADGVAWTFWASD
jgi:hypothetical protein